MGKVNLSAIRVRRRALANIQTQKTRSKPCWVDVVGDIPPAQVLTRQQPQQHPITHIRTRALPDGKTQQYIQSNVPKRTSKTIKPSRMFSPLPLRYEEDALRKQFYSDHPWELARPRVILETTGDQHAGADWSKGIAQPNMPLSGESLVQRQLHLLQNTPDITRSEAYDVARKEFYVLRRQEATRRRIAAEEAEATGAQFGTSVLSWGMQIENKMYDDWENWARNVLVEQDARSAAFSGQTMPAQERDAVEEAYTSKRQTGTSSRIGDAVFSAEEKKQASMLTRR